MIEETYLKKSKKLYEESFNLKQEALYSELKHYIEKGETYIKPVNEWQHRGIGKTHTLMQLAKEYNCPVIYPRSNNYPYIKLNYDFFNGAVELISEKGCNIANLLNYDLILCDEGVTPDFRKLLEFQLKHVVGYKAEGY
jgi:hypothetical protein